ncbi:amidase [candidate division KSB3 bacterium]|nr:amidase [candidate division KSB3 bacterium]
MIAKAPLAKTAQALRTGTLDLPEYIKVLCDKIDANEPQIQAFVPETDRRSRLVREAADLQKRFSDPVNRPPLYGIPVGIKDIFRVNGFPTHAGSSFPPDLFTGAEAACVTLLKEAGALIAGKTVTTEFAYFEPGPTRNPYNLNHTPGGSSSGSAAGVACGFFPLALGTQTIGSVIRPAAFCGIIGFKPSFDRIPTAGLLFFSKSLDHVGLFTQDLQGVELACSIMCRDWQPVTPDDRLPMLGVPDGPYLEHASAEGLAAFEAQIKTLAQAGYQIKRVRMFENFEALNQQHRQMMAAEAAQEHADWFARYRGLYRPKTLEILLKGQQVSAAELDAARAARLQLRQQLTDLQADQGIDCWISPPATGPAPEGIHATGNPIMNLPWTNTGLPTITIPAGMSANHLPLGFQCTAGFGQDEQLLAWMQGIQAALEHGAPH